MVPNLATRLSHFHCHIVIEKEYNCIPSEIPGLFGMWNFCNSKIVSNSKDCFECFYYSQPPAGNETLGGLSHTNINTSNFFLNGTFSFFFFLFFSFSFFFQLSHPNINTPVTFFPNGTFSLKNLDSVVSASHCLLWTFKVGSECTKPILTLCKKFNKFLLYICFKITATWSWGFAYKGFEKKAPKFFCTFSSEGW